MNRDIYVGEVLTQKVTSLPLDTASPSRLRRAPTSPVPLCPTLVLGLAFYIDS